MISPHWNVQSRVDKAYLQVLVDVFASQRVKLEERDQVEGFKILSRFLCQSQKGRQDEDTFYFCDSILESDAEDEVQASMAKEQKRRFGRDIY